VTAVFLILYLAAIVALHGGAAPLRKLLTLASDLKSRSTASPPVEKAEA
jgi:hypothetical protein